MWGWRVGGPNGGLEVQEGSEAVRGAVLSTEVPAAVAAGAAAVAVAGAAAVGAYEEGPGRAFGCSPASSCQRSGMCKTIEMLLNTLPEVA